MLFDIRAELDDGTSWDFVASGEPTQPTQPTHGEKVPEYRAARERAGDRIKERFGEHAQLEWRGMVVFVNRPASRFTWPSAR
jgi:hypothetical protein